MVVLRGDFEMKAFWNAYRIFILLVGMMVTTPYWQGWQGRIEQWPTEDITWPVLSTAAAISVLIAVQLKIVSIFNRRVRNPFSNISYNFLFFLSYLVLITFVTGYVFPWYVVTAVCMLTVWFSINVETV